MVFLIAILVVVADQLTKWLVLNHLAEGQGIDIIPGIFSLTHIENRGAAFGVLEGNIALFVLLTAIIIGVVYYFYKKQEKNLILTWAVGLIFGGAVGNLIDRLVKHSVTDMFNFHIWPVFNIADIAVCVGCALLCVYIFKEPS